MNKKLCYFILGLGKEDEEGIVCTYFKLSYLPGKLSWISLDFQQVNFRLVVNVLQSTTRRQTAFKQRKKKIKKLCSDVLN